MAHEIAEHGERKPFQLSLRVKQGIAIVVSATALLAAGCSSHTWRSQRAVAERSSSETVRGWSPSVFGPMSTRLVFVSNRTGNYHIYEKNLTSGRITALTTGSYDDMNPQVSPNEKKLVFYSDRTGSNQIYTLNLQNPGNVVQLTHDAGGVNDYDPVFMPNGQHIVYKRSNANGEYGDIWKMNTDGSGQRNVTPGFTRRGIEGWKPTPINDDEVVITERAVPKDPYSDNLDTLNVQSGAITPLTNNTLSNWFPDYSPQSHRLIFVTKEVQYGNDVLATRGLGSSALKILVRMPGDNDDPSWSPNGQYAVFLNNNDGPCDVYAVNAGNGAIRLLDKSPPGSDDLSPILIY